MITENLSTLKIHKLSQEQYNKAVENGNVEANALYLTPVEDDIKKHNSSTTAHEDIRKVVSDNTKRVNNLEKDLNIDKQKIEENKSQFDIKSVEGVNPVINNGANTSFYGMKLYGKTEQRTTTGKNLLENTLSSQSRNGITLTVNADKSITVNNTAASDTYFTLNENVELKAGKYIFSGGIDGGSSTSYQMYIAKTDGTPIAYITTSTPHVLTFSEDTAVLVLLCIYHDTTVNNLTFYPMIRLASITDPTYEPYTGNDPSPNPQYPQPLESVGKWGNLFNHTATTQTVSGVTFTVNADKSITANGKSTEVIAFPIGEETVIPKGCKISGVTGGSNSTYVLRLFDYEVNGVVTDITSGSHTTTQEYKRGALFIRIASGVTLNNVTFYPMISTEDIPYRPYSGQMEIESAVLGGNLLPYPYRESTKTSAGITWTDNGDGSLTINGTSTGESYFNLKADGSGVVKGNLFLSGNIDGVTLYGRGEDGVTVYDSGNGALLPNGLVFLNLYIGKGKTFNNVTIYPMLSRGEKAFPWTPYTKQSHISLVSDGLKGIPVTDASLATYTDEKGQMWCSDYVDCDRGVLVQRIGNLVLDGTEPWAKEGTGWFNSTFYLDATTGALKDNWIKGFNENYIYMICSHFIAHPRLGFPQIGKTGYCCASSEGRSMEFTSDLSTVADWKAFVAEQYANGTPVTVQYILATPIETPLSASEIASYKTLHSNHGITTVMNDCDAYMKIGYLDQKYDDGVMEVVEKIVESKLEAFFTAYMNEIAELQGGDA